MIYQDVIDLVPSEDLGPVVKPTPPRETLRVVPMSEVKEITGVHSIPDGCTVLHSPTFVKSPVSCLPTDAKERKKVPIGTGVLDYFPAALAEVARVSFAGNEQHNPGQELHWARSKSQDQADTMLRHFLERGTLDTDGQRHSAKMAWRALAILQLEMEAEGAPVARGAK